MRLESRGLDVVRFSNAEIRRLVTALIEEVGDGWLTDQRNIPKGSDLHQLAQWISQAERELKADQLGSKTSQTMLRLAWLAHALETLRTAGVGGVEERRSRLLAAGDDLFHATLHELRTASVYLHLGHQVAFLPEGEERSADILVDGHVEVECKRKTGLTPRDRHRQFIYECIRRRIRRIVDKSKDPDGVEVAAHFRSEPDKGTIDDLVERAKRLLQNPACYLEFSRNAEREFTIRRIHPYLTQAGIGLQIDRDIASEFDVVEVQESVGRTPSGDEVHEKITFIAFKSDKEEDHVKSLRRSLDAASRQLSSVGAGVVEIDVTPIANKLVAGELDRTRDVIESVLRSRSSVSAIRIVREQFLKDETGWVMSLAVETLLNPGARHPLPDDWRQRSG